MRTSRVVPSGMVMPAQWSFLSSPSADGVTNMAIDAALMDLVPSRGAVWRCYGWERPTVSFGRNERTTARFSSASLRDAGLPAVRRPTGGRALLHSREVTYSVVLPLDERVPWRAAYDAINALLLRALLRLDVPAQLVQARDTVPLLPNGPVCFDAPADGEIVVNGRKLVGSAVWRQGASYLQHGSILLADDQAMLTTAAVRPIPLPPPAASLGECAPHISPVHVVKSLAAILGETVAAMPDGALTEFLPSAAYAERVDVHRRAFATDEWLWRR